MDKIVAEFLGDTPGAAPKGQSPGKGKGKGGGPLTQAGRDRLTVHILILALTLNQYAFAHLFLAILANWSCGVLVQRLPRKLSVCGL